MSTATEEAIDFDALLADELPCEAPECDAGAEYIICCRACKQPFATLCADHTRRQMEAADDVQRVSDMFGAGNQWQCRHCKHTGRFLDLVEVRPV